MKTAILTSILAIAIWFCFASACRANLIEITTANATTIDLGASRPVKTETNLISFAFQGSSFDITFAPGQFVHLQPHTPTLFDALVVFQTSGPFGFLTGTGYLLDANMQPIFGFGITGSASGNGMEAIGLFPLCKDKTGAAAFTDPTMNFFGVHYDLNFPTGITVTGAQFRLADGPFQIEKVPDTGSTALFMLIGFSWLFWPSRRPK